MSLVDSRDAVIRVAVPARPDVLHLLRSVAASVGARVGLSVDDLEELRIAVDEAASLLLEHARDAERVLHLELDCDARTVVARIWLEPAPRDHPDDDLVGSWGWRVISAVTDGASIERTPTGTTVTFAKSAPRTDR
jgi:serine/threonine-protein kinase RsbW